ncbi:MULTISPECIES: class I SAM-dependent methyltransferase [Lysinibacillus]|uniref:Class I SAM-dependent methyltransferase n=1 Tax=Lysinibacillus fusiformis TaxID=28031 RepID=A0A2I0V0L3_9BACI|nr:MULTISPECIES: class I SAM-dependent methyltransferase [Lysinibacillus]MEE3806164.1 class I SAM-dependent methyltransferase [Lysinibacillus fusiformis]PKU51809.1 class I SAM-dependent methyltransferase [Lysinibacillus fusiformis]WCH46090.1 class I SAM-dependent methyltransferase [Lysinibacillus sp. OF-1]SCZ07093.1 Methyltransferase domain-containing protein [Lysinibacillus sp. SG9]SDB51866.1 Methyltransferase domain-containing protein [Lysinibacillus sp. TC-37]
MTRKGPLAINYEALWQEGMKDWHGMMPERMVNDQLEEQFWAQSVARKKIGQTDPYAQRIFQELQKSIEPQYSVLEIGPGWGNYTFPLAERVDKLTCVDSSESMLHYLQQCMPHQEHVSYVHAKWESLESDEIEPHDIVLGVNCFYRMYEIKAALSHMNRLAKKRAIIGMTTGPIQPHYERLYEKYGYEIKFPRRDYIEFLNLLYEMNIYADCQIIPLERVYEYESYEQLVTTQSKKILTANVQQAHVEEALSPFIEEKEGRYYYRHDFHAALVSWQPK